MDYGQSVNNPNQDPVFFTAGVGDIPENLNPDINGSLNTNQYSPEHDLKNVGNAAIASSNQASNVEKINFSDLPHSQLGIDPKAPSEVLGQITSLEPPKNLSDTENQAPFNKSAIKTTEKLNESGVKAFDNIVTKFKQDDNAANFYEAARDMMEDNLKNSYGDQAAWKGESK